MCRVVSSIKVQGKKKSFERIPRTVFKMASTSLAKAFSMYPYERFVDKFKKLDQTKV